MAGTAEGSRITGTVAFYPFRDGVLVMADIHGLPRTRGDCPDGFFALHIHQGGSCEGEGFPLTGSHYDPKNCPHPGHAGDLPPLLSNSGHAFMAVYTNRFTVPEITGRTVIIHSMPDDFTTQPAGAAGEKIACGVIHR
jgi:Cu-Zn family superoxide dismutase